jgi:hypothetical protein
MTICVAVKVHDCVVFAADSATSLTGIDESGTPAVINLYSHGNKVFNLVAGQPLAAMTCGMGNIGKSSISSLAKEFRRRLRAEKLGEGAFTVGEVAERAKRFLYDETYLSLPERPAGEHSLEFFIGGYGSDGIDAELWKIIIINGDCIGPVQQMPGQDAFVVWAGQPEALNRLLLGYSGNVLTALLAGGLEQEKLPGVEQLIREHTATPLVDPPMPTGDAIALADFLVDVAKRYVHFLHGADSVGGDADIATVTRYEGFKWIKRKHFYPRELNLETDHV